MTSARRHRLRLLLLVIGVVSILYVGFLFVGAHVGVSIVDREGRQLASSLAANPAPTPRSSSPTPAATPSFANATELAAAMAAHGLGCDNPQVISHPTVATSLVDCGPDLSVAVYANGQLAMRGWEVLSSQSRASGGAFQVHMAVGSNWTINATDPVVAQEAVRLFGGFYLHTD